MMRRREFIAGLGSAAAWAMAARAQQSSPVVGVLQDGTGWTQMTKVAFMRGLAEAGYVEGRNVVIEERFARGDAARLREMALELVRLRVAVIATPGATPPALAAKAATSTIPIVFSVGVDPVRTGLVSNLGKPSGNVTGYSEVQTEVWSKRFGLLRLLVPTAARFAALDYPGNPLSEVVAKEAREITEATGLPIEILSVSDDAGVDAAFLNLRPKRIDALLVSPGGFFYGRRNEIIRLAAAHAIPAAYHLRDYPVAGGLMSYGSSLEEGFRQVGVYSGRILNGAKPVDLPVVQATKFEFVINLKTAKALGLNATPDVLSITDEVIE